VVKREMGASDIDGELWVLPPSDRHREKVAVQCPRIGPAQLWPRFIHGRAAILRPYARRSSLARGGDLSGHTVSANNRPISSLAP
jgi:hypothetical protein